MSRYRVETNEGVYQEGSGDLVLSNKLEITSVEEIAEAETYLLSLLYDEVISYDWELIENISFQTIKEWHSMWLGEIYDWAGDLRTVNMSKGSFLFAASNRIESALESFEADYLSKFSDLNNMTENELIRLLAKSHVEFILIHPFRDGNGRIGRLLLDTMVCAAGYEPLDYSLWIKHKDYYIKSIQAGVCNGEYQYMEKLIRDVMPT